MKRISLIFAIVTQCASAYSQKHGVILNIEDGLPIRDVKIFTNNNKTATTNWLGEYTIYTDFKSATISHGKYLPVTMKIEEMPDTIFMLPKLTTLEGVIVWGKRPEISPFVFKSTDPTINAPIKQSPSGMDFLSIFRKKPMSKRQRQKHNEIIDTY